jgi:hypothetical protein
MHTTLNEEFNDFLSSVPAMRLKQNMAKVLLVYLQHEYSSGLPDFMDDFLTDLMGLFDLLDAIERGGEGVAIRLG